MGRVTTNRRVVIAAVILSCLSVWTVQCVAAGKAKTAAEGQSAQKTISQWLAIFPNQQYVCWGKESPWKGLDKLQSPPAGVKSIQTISLDMGKNEYESTSFVLTNLSAKPMEFKITCGPSPVGISTTLRKAVWMTLDDGSQHNDALCLIDNGKVVIPSGESLEIWVTLHTQNAPDGKNQQTITVAPKGLKSWKVNIDVMVYDVSLPEPLPLAVFYYDELLTMDMSPKLVKSYMTKMKTHHVNHAFVHPDNLPRLAADSDGKLVTNYTQFDKIMDDYKTLNPKRYIFFWAAESFMEPSGKWHQDHPESINRPKHMSPEWKALFRAWLKDWIAHMKARGMGYDNFMMLPYDERGGRTVINTIKLIKEIDPNVLVLFNGKIGGSAESIKKNLAPYIDAWKPYLYHYLGTGGVWGGTTQSGIPLKPNTDYTLSFYIKNAGSSLYLDVSFNGSTSRQAIEFDAADWRICERKFTTASDTDKMYLGFFPNVGNKALLIDDVVVREKNGPNLVANGDMEAKDLTVSWPVNKSKIIANTTDPHSGKQCLEIRSNPRPSDHERTVVKRVLGQREGKFFWTYANPIGIDPGRASPYGAYRLPVWLAWKEGMNGFSNWAYKNGYWNGKDKGPNWGLVYRTDQADTPPEVSKQELVIQSKRWDASREGVEDFAYLYLLKQAIGKASPEAAAKAKKLLDSCVENVLKDDNNPHLAEKAKKQIMEELVKMSDK